MERPTIRQNIRGQVWKWSVLVLGGALAVVASTFLSRPHQPASREEALVSWVLIGGGFVTFLGGAMGTQFARCPKCSARLGSFGTQVAYGSPVEGAGCPYCGVNLDERVPRKVIS
jgi:DNA-directed RNA polymerase subunit RPC12/RpoP